MTRRLLGFMIVALVATAPQASAQVERAATAAFQQAPRGGARAGAARGAAPASVAEAERLFDRYMLGQARVVLQLTPDQMASFAQRFDRLQTLQRMRQRQRQRRLVELAALNRSGAGADDATVASLLQALDADMADADRRVREARDGLDEVLTVRQRARYRTFEQRMEREKLQLIARARAAARARAVGEPAPPPD